MGICIYCANISSHSSDIIVPDSLQSQNSLSHSNSDKDSRPKFIKLKTITTKESENQNMITNTQSDMISTECYLRTNSMLKSINEHETSTNIIGLIHKKTSSSSILTTTIQSKAMSNKNTNINNTNSSCDKITNQFEVYAKSQTKFISNDVINLINDNYLFNYYVEDNGIKSIVDDMVEYQIDEGVVIFKEGEIGGGMFIIKNGQIELTSSATSEKNVVENYNTTHRVKLYQNDYFGELSIMTTMITRKYTARALSQVNFYFIDNNLYKCNKRKGKHMLNKFMNVINKVPFLKMLTEEERTHLALLSREVEIVKGEDIANSDNIYILMSGSCIVEFENAKKIFNKECDIIGLETIFYLYVKKNIMNTPMKKQTKNIYVEKITPLEKTKFLFISQKCLIEIFGLSYNYRMLSSVFKSAYDKSTVLTTLFGQNGNAKIYKIFNLIKYNFDDVVYDSHLRNSLNPIYTVASSENENSKLTLVLIGSLGFAKSEQDDFTISNGIFGEEYLTTAPKSSIVSKSDFCYALECDWKKIRDEVHSYNTSLAKKLKKLSNIEFLFTVSDIELIEISQHVIPFTYNEDDVIISPKVECNHFFMVTKGEVKHKIIGTNKTLYTYRKNSSFGGMFLLNPSANSKSILVASSKVVKTYAIDKEYFITLIQKENLNDCIKRMMCLEDNNIMINELYYLSYLGRGQFGNVCLVHNQIAIYAAKLISKTTIEKSKNRLKYLASEKKALSDLSHPFIVKYIKTLKAKGWCIFLMEYVSGKTLSDLCTSNKLKKNIEYIKFYGACLFIILDYLTSMHYIHRDIKPANIMIDTDGYVKLIDFGTTKKVQDNSIDFKQTVIGTPNFMAPEVINGKQYSYPCDYWSVGVTLYYIYYGEYPFGKESTDVLTVYQEIINKEVTFPNDSNSYEVTSLLSALLNKNQHERLKSFTDIKEHYIFRNLPWDDLLRKRVRPPFLPGKDKRVNEAYLCNLNTPFTSFLDNEKFEGNNNTMSSNRYLKPNNDRNFSFHSNNFLAVKSYDLGNTSKTPKSKSNINLVKVNINSKSSFAVPYSRRYSNKDWFEDF